jgi:hypothetical protein
MTPAELQFKMYYTKYNTSTAPVSSLVKRVFNIGYLAVTGHPRAALLQLESLSYDPSLPEHFLSTIYRIAANCRTGKFGIDLAVALLIEVTNETVASIESNHVVIHTDLAIKSKNIN